MTDTLRTTIYYVQDRFMIVDYGGKARKKDDVAVERLPGGQIAVERYVGQRHLGVIRYLTNYFPEAKVKQKKSKKRDSNPFPHEIAV